MLASVLVFLLFFNPVSTGVELLYRWLSSLAVNLLLGPYPDSVSTIDGMVVVRRYNSLSSAIESVILVFVVLGVGSILISAGWWLYSLGANLARALGFRNPVAVDVAQQDRVEAPSQNTNFRTIGPEREPDSARVIYQREKPLLGIQYARVRLESHVVSLRNASIVNLFAGMCVAVVGIAVLYTVFIDIEKFGALTEKKIDPFDFLIFSLLPRISATLFIQIFAYFFLLMYRSNLADVRYFQNEMSNLDLFGTGVSMALNEDVSPIQKSVISSLLKMERNRVMNKNQKVITPLEDAEAHLKLVATLNQLTTKLKDAAAKPERG
ncbi:hypothetical protein XI06_39985 [Bradyrhizobium sp. CCBAU 11434]|nr:hypothetical protein [Bradyrhizobium sp. CCBAU 11434]